LHEKRQAVLAKLQLRIALTCMALTGLVLLAACLLALRTAVRETQSGADSAFSSQCQTVEALLSAENGIDTEKLLRFSGQNRLLVAVNDSGTLLTFAPAAAKPFLSGLLAASGLEDAFWAAQGAALQNVHLNAQGQSYRAQLSSGVGSAARWYNTVIFQPEDTSVLRRLRWTYSGIFFGGMLLLAGIARLLARQIVRPAEEAQQEQLRFFAGASHELKSPLAVIASSVERLRHETDDTARQYRRIQREIDRMAQLMDDMLVLSSAGTGKRTLCLAAVQPEDVLLSVYEAYAELMEQRGQTLCLVLPDEALPTVKADAQRLRQILTILLDNAYKHTPPGQEITLCAAQTAHTVEFQVIDHGQGIPDSEKAHVFEFFYQGSAPQSGRARWTDALPKNTHSNNLLRTAKSEHFGLGLAVASELAKQHGARLTLTDTLGGGATFTLAFFKISAKAAERGRRGLLRPEQREQQPPRAQDMER